MLPFEALLLKQLQKQQSRAEFCDAVLQTQGVSVPVHSCVLSAFSPWLCGALTSMPAPLTGQKRLIKLQAVEACTLLSLVSLLYSGQLHDNRQEVLLAAESLGIELPQQHADGQYGGKRTTKEWVDPQEDTVRGRREQDRRMSEGDKDMSRECSSQTEDRSETKEKTTQTDPICSDPQVVCLIGQSTSSTNQGHCVYSNASDVTLMLPRDQSPPEKRPYTCDVLSVAPSAEAYQTDGPTPHVKRPRGRPRLHPLQPPSISHASYAVAPTNQNTASPLVPSLLHTVPLPPAPDATDCLLDDIMTGFHFLPAVPAEKHNTQHGVMNTAIPNVSPVLKTTYPSMYYSVKPVDPKFSQQQPEGELNDILDNFLRTFDGCGLDLEEESSQVQSQHYTAIRNSDGALVSGGSQKSGSSMDPWSNTPITYTELQVLRPHSVHHHPPQANFCAHCTYGSSTCPQLPPQLNKAENRLQVPSVLRRQKRSSHRQRAEGQPRKLSGAQNLETQIETRRMTRSQSIKRKLEPALNSFTAPAARKRGRRSRGQSRSPTAGARKKSRGVGRPRCVRRRADACTTDAKVSNGKANEGGGAQTQSARTVKNTAIQQFGEGRRRKMSVSVRRRRANGQDRRRRKKEEPRRKTRHRGGACLGGSSDQPVVHKEHGRGTIPEVTSSAFEKMRIFLESQRKKEEEHKRAEESKQMCKEKERLGRSTVALHQGVSRGEETSRDAPGGRRAEHRGTPEAGEESTLNAEHDADSQTHVPSNAEFVTSPQEETKRVNGDNESVFSMTESSQSTLGSLWGDPLSTQLTAHSLHNHKPLLPSPKGIMLKMADLTLDSGEKTKTKNGEEQRLLSHTILCHKCLPFQKPMTDLPESMGSSEEEDVDVLEVSSTASDPVTMPITVWGSGPEEEEEDDVEVDVLGVESD